MQRAIVFLTVQPSPECILFAEELQRAGHTVFLAIDDPTYDARKLPFATIQYSSDLMQAKGYIGLLLPYTAKNRPCAWEKAMYHFCEVAKSYKQVWFLEDDVFVSSADAFENINRQYPHADLVCRANIHSERSCFWPHWYMVQGKMQKPWYRSMMCACRLSRKLLNLIATFVEKKKYLCYHEIFFNTLAVQNNLRIRNPPELQGILWRFEWTKHNIQRGCMYHPVKNQSNHPILRKELAMYPRKNQLSKAAIPNETKLPDAVKIEST